MSTRTVTRFCGVCSHMHSCYERVTSNPEPQPEAQALALLRELNDALVIPGWLQTRVDAVLDQAEEKR